MLTDLPVLRLTSDLWAGTQQDRYRTLTPANSVG